MNSILKFLLDQSPRRLYYFLRGKLNRQERLREFAENHPCVFVLSTGRVGTETLDALFGLSSNVFSYHEPAPLLYQLSRLSYQYAEDKTAREILKHSFLTSRIDLLSYSLNCHRGYIETSPQVTFLAPIILESLSGARFIHLIRSPHAVIRSGMRRNWFNGHPGDETRILPNSDSPAAAQWAGYTPFQKNAWLWSETNRWILEFISKLPPAQALTIHAEDIFSMQPETIETMYQFIGSSLPARRKIEKILQKKMNRQNKGEFPEAHLWSTQQKTELAKLASDVASKLNYDLLKDDE
ncbi:MAG: sulfotransferase [Anaerolineales bacterium]|nr:sulfotransferase [Anaerolineales bacterium]